MVFHYLAYSSMKLLRNHGIICLILLSFAGSCCYGSWFNSNAKNKEFTSVDNQCFCQLKGIIDDCSCSVETIDSFNNLKVYPRLKSILEKDYFRYWKVNLNRGCPFWEDDFKCAIRYCSIKECHDVPRGIEDGISQTHNSNLYSNEEDILHQDCDKEGDLGYLNTSISEKSIANFERWAAHDSAHEDSFCYLEDETSLNSRYVDLLLNPERYTGYAGPSAHRVWRSIYQENCFKPTSSNVFTEITNFGGQEFLKEMCLEKRTFYRAISGLHSSINIHLSAKYLLSDKNGFMDHPDGVWGPNLAEFQKRFNPDNTNGHGPKLLKNLYFLYLLELRALSKVGPYLDSLQFFTGNEGEDKEMKNAVNDLIKVIISFPDHFNEQKLFGGNKKSVELKKEFREHFLNVSRIMDCVGCDKCRLWGKLQVTGLGTALKILFSGKFDEPITTAKEINFHLTRNEIVALFNAFGRLSNSISELDNFRSLIEGGTS